MASMPVDRRAFLEWGAVGLLASQLPLRAGAAPLALEEATVEGLQAEMQAGRLSAVQLAQAYLDRIRSLDARLGSVIEVNPEALAIARALDEERAAKGPRGPLHGIPVLLKDNLDTADRMKTTAGSLALAEAPAPKQDATVAARLRAAGALILGKTNLSEWANFRSTHSVSGWSGRGGQTRNPYALDRNPSGSSSGSGAAVAANLCALGVGTETDGSIVSPASICGLVGLKPTVGLVSRAGIIPISRTQDTAGPMTRTVRDAAILLGAMAGVDPRDPATQAAQGHLHPDYTRFLDPRALKGARLGILRNQFGQHPRVDEAILPLLGLLKREGAQLVDLELKTEAFEAAELEVMLFEFKADLNAYLAQRGGAVKDLAGLMAFNQNHAKAELDLFGQEILEQAQAKGGLEDPAYRKALQTCAQARQSIEKALEMHKLDALVAPTGGPAWLTDPVNGDHFGPSCSTLAAVAGTPHLTVPAAFAHDLPLGLSFLGGPWDEPALLRLGFAFEQATRARRAPKLPPSLSR